MKVGESVRKAIDDHGAGELDAAMLHACNAVDGTAKKVHPVMGSNARFTQLLRDNHGILGPMGMPGINIVDTRFAVEVKSPKAPGGGVDLADVIYGVHRCSHGHGDDLPAGFELMPNVDGPPRYSSLFFEPGRVRLSDRIIFGLLAVAVLAPVNMDQHVPDGYWLGYGANVHMEINEWWGRADDFSAIVATDPPLSVIFDFGEWLTGAHTGAHSD